MDARTQVGDADATRRGSRGLVAALRASCALGALALALWALAETAATALANGYAVHGLWRATLFVFADGVESRAGPLLALCLAVGVAAAWLERRSAVGLLAAATALGAALCLNTAHIGLDAADFWRMPAFLARRGFRDTPTEAAAALALGALVLALGSHPRSRAALARLFGGPLLSGRALLALGLALALPWAGARWLRGREAAALPNLLLISLDTLRADHLGVYGYRRPTSPEIDRIAGESHVFDWAISQAPHTLPSHMSLFTSLYPSVHGVRELEDALPGDRITLAEYLLDRGYRTAAITDAAFLRGSFGFRQGFERYDEWRRSIADTVHHALSWLDDGLAEEPFFLFVHSYEVHSPYDPPEPFRGEFADPDYAGDLDPIPSELEKLRIAARAGDPGARLSPEDAAFLTARYDEGIRYADHWIGRLAAELDARGLLDTTWLILLSDHGEELTEHGSVHHEKLYHTVTRVPLILRPPGGIPGRRIDTVVELIDVLPTLLELAGVEPRASLQGRSLLPLMRGGRSDWPQAAYSEFERYERSRALTTDSLHLIAPLEGGEPEAYRYRGDPLEQRPLRGARSRGEVDAARRTLRSWIEEQRRRTASGGTGARAAPSEATLRELRALGYVE